MLTTLLVALLASRSLAFAQVEPVRVAVLPLVQPADAATEAQLVERTEVVARALGDAGLAVVDPVALQHRLGVYARLPTPALSAADRAAFQLLVRQAWLSVGRRDVAQAKAAIRDAMAFARARLESLNRVDALAETLLNLCLLTPRVLVNEGASRQAVVAEAMECRKLVPRVSPSESDHVPEVMAALREGDKILAATAPATLVVQGALAQGCTAFLNGRRYGELPLRASVAAGQYLLQVECPAQSDGSGLVHAVTLVAGQTTTVELAPFERYVRATAGGFQLARGAGEGADADAALAVAARSLAEVLEVERLVLVEGLDGERTRLWVAHSDVGPGSCSAEATTPELSAKVRELMVCAATSTAVTESAVEDIPAERVTRHYASIRASRTRLLGVVLSASGVAVLAAAWVGHVATDDRGRGTGDRILQGVGAAGTVLAAAGEPLWMPVGPRHAPWWTWVGMAAAAGPVAGAAVLWKRDTTCALYFVDGGGCATFENTRTPASLALMTSIPLLTLPASFYVSRATWGRVTVQPDVTPQARRLGIAVQGTF